MGMKLLLVLIIALVVGLVLMSISLIGQGIEDMRESRNQKILDDIERRSCRRNVIDGERYYGRYPFESDKT